MLKSLDVAPGAVMPVRLQLGAASTSSVAVIVTWTGTIALFGGVMLDGEAVKLVMLGGVVSGGAAASTDLVAGVPGAAPHGAGEGEGASGVARTGPGGVPGTEEA